MKILKTRIDLLDIVEKEKKICEIGVFKGEFSKLLINTLTPTELHLIDIFEGKMCSGDKDGNNIIWTNLDEEFVKLKKHFSDNDNIYLHKGFSSEILKSFDNEYFDMIYIDGDHSYNGVKKDLEISFEKVKKGGYICGHDYTTVMFPNVVKAVDEFCTDKKLVIDYITQDGCPSFCIKKN